MVKGTEHHRSGSQVVVQSLKKTVGNFFEYLKSDLVEFFLDIFLYLFPTLTQTLLHLDHVIGCYELRHLILLRSY